MPGDDNFELSITIGDASFSASGPEAFVKEALAEFKKLAEVSGSTGAGSGGGSASGGEGGKGTRRRQRTTTGGKQKADAGEKRDPIDASSMTLPQLLNEAKLSGNDKIATAILIWSADHESKAALTRGEILEHWRRTRVKVPANPSRDLANAVRKGWISESGGQYTAEGYGRAELGFD